MLGATGGSGPSDRDAASCGLEGRPGRCTGHWSVRRADFIQHMRCTTRTWGESRLKFCTQERGCASERGACTRRTSSGVGCGEWAVAAAHGGGGAGTARPYYDQLYMKSVMEPEGRTLSPMEESSEREITGRFLPATRRLRRRAMNREQDMTRTCFGIIRD